MTVQEASRNLSELLHSAAESEEITIHDGDCTVLLQPVAAPSHSSVKRRPALRQLQSQSRLTPAQAEDYFREVHAERLAHESSRTTARFPV